MMISHTARPFTGDFRGYAWNGAALVATKTARQSVKKEYMLQLMATHDFAIVTETHGTDGKCKAYSLPEEYVAHWSNLTS